VKAHHSGWLFALKIFGWLFRVVFTDYPGASFTGVAPNYVGISFSYTYTKKKICQTPTIWKSETHGDWKINTTERNKLEWTLSLLTTAPPFDFHVQFQNDPGFIIFYLQTTPFLCGYRQELRVNTSNWN
jgi:hypothetical protein